MHKGSHLNFLSVQKFPWEEKKEIIFSVWQQEGGGGKEEARNWLLFVVFGFLGFCVFLEGNMQFCSKWSFRMWHYKYELELRGSYYSFHQYKGRYLHSFLFVCFVFCLYIKTFPLSFNSFEVLELYTDDKECFIPFILHCFVLLGFVFLFFLFFLIFVCFSSNSFFVLKKSFFANKDCNYFSILENGILANIKWLSTVKKKIKVQI